MKQPERLLNGRKHVRNGGFDQISHYLRGLSPLGRGEPRIELGLNATPTLLSGLSRQKLVQIGVVSNDDEGVSVNFCQALENMVGFCWRHQQKGCSWRNASAGMDWIPRRRQRSGEDKLGTRIWPQKQRTGMESAVVPGLKQFFFFAVCHGEPTG